MLDKSWRPVGGSWLRAGRSGATAMSTRTRTAVEVLIGLCLVLSAYLGLRRSRVGLWPAGRIASDSGYHQVMGTFARVVVVADDVRIAERCIRRALAEIRRIDELMSDYKGDSEISQVNRHAYERAVKVSRDTFEVLRKSIRYSRLSRGAFDVTVGPLVDLWRAAAEANRPPSPQQLQQVRGRVGYEKLVLDANALTVRFKVEGMRVDLGAVAKGYAVDKAVMAVRKAGAIGGMVDIGGDIRCFGAPPAGRTAWLVGVQDPRSPVDLPGTGKPILVLRLVKGAVATSGSYQRSAMIGGQRYSHIIDGRTGGSAVGLWSVTVICDEAADADALATAISVMGREKGLALIEQIPRAEAIVIPQGPQVKIVKSSGADGYIR